MCVHFMSLKDCEHSSTQIGNYLGALRNWVKMQRDAKPQDQLIFSIVGWHALTLPQNPKSLLEARNDMLAVLLAIGLDPQRSIIFHQDQVNIFHSLLLRCTEIFVQNPDHTELAWILNCLTPFGKLRRMTTWKVKPRHFLSPSTTDTSTRVGLLCPETRMMSLK